MQARNQADEHMIRRPVYSLWLGVQGSRFKTVVVVMVVIMMMMMLLLVVVVMVVVVVVSIMSVSHYRTLFQTCSASSTTSVRMTRATLAAISACREVDCDEFRYHCQCYFRGSSCDFDGSCGFNMSIRNPARCVFADGGRHRFLPLKGHPLLCSM